MSDSIKSLMDLGLSEIEAQRVLARKAKAEATAAAAVARAEKRLPKILQDLGHASNRADHWATIRDGLQEKADAVRAIIDGTTTEVEAAEEVAEAPAEVAEAPAKKTRTTRRK